MPWGDGIVFAKGAMAATVLAVAVNLLTLAVPIVALTVGWSRLVEDWRHNAVQSIAVTACLVFATASTLVAVGSLFWQFLSGLFLFAIIGPR